MTFVATNKAPGVYIDEIQLPGPIAPAGTSTAAFIGPALSGPLYTPFFLTNAQQFTDKFGGYIEDPLRVFATHAVNGFFNENGSTCYFVRVGTGVQASLALKDRGTANPPLTALVVTALAEGAAGNKISVAVADASISSTSVAKAQAATSGPAAITSASKLDVEVANAADAARFSPGDWVIVDQPGPPVQSEQVQVKSVNGQAITLTAELVNNYGAGTLKLASASQLQLANAADAAKFMPGDSVLIEQAGPPALSETAQVASVSGATLTFAASLTNKYTVANIRLADLMPGQTRIRLTGVTGIEPGSCLRIGPDPFEALKTEDGVVRTVDTITGSVTLTSGLALLHGMKPSDPVVPAKTLEFKLTITSPAAGAEVFDTLAMDPRHSRYFASVIKSVAVSVALADPPTSTPPSNNRPSKTDSAQPLPLLTNGVDDDISKITTAHYHRAIDKLLLVPDVNLLCIPDAVGGNFSAADTQDIQSYMVAHCEKVVNRFAILDSVSGANTDVSKVVAQRNNLNSERGMASLYFPWIKISNPLGSGRVSVPPSGHIAGVFANNDNTRGVFKAPANEPVTMALDLADVVTDDVQGPLNEQGINVIRAFPGRGILVWGARTIAPKDITQWRYNSIRRFVNFVEASLRDGTRFAVFEPNNPTLWGTVQRLVKDFLNTQWAEGALEGVKPEDGFSVRVDAALNPPQVIALGQLIVEVKLYTVPPAEFVVFQIIQQPGGSNVTEST